MSPCRRHPLFLTGLLIAAFPGSADGQGLLLGTVRQDSTLTPLGGVEILIEGTNFRTTSDPSGRYRLSAIPAGTPTVLFRLVGHRSYRERLSVGPSDSVVRDVILVRQSVQVLDSVSVTGRVTRGVGIGFQAFEERRARGFGLFIDSTLLRRSEHRRVADLFWGLQGVEMIRGPDGELWAANGRGGTSIIRGGNRPIACFMSILRDGNLLYAPSGYGRQVDLNRDILVSELEAIEVYRSAAEVPGEYSGASAACGVILLWTRRGR